MPLAGAMSTNNTWNGFQCATSPHHHHMFVTEREDAGYRPRLTGSDEQQSIAMGGSRS